MSEQDEIVAKVERRLSVVGELVQMLANFRRADNLRWLTSCKMPFAEN